MKVSKTQSIKNSQKEYQTHENSKRPNWLARGTISHFLTSIGAKHQKVEGGPFREKKFPSKSHNAEKTERGPFSFWYCMLRGKEEKPFWFSLLGQMIQFGTIKFRTTFKNYFGQFVWIEKSHYYSRVSLPEAPTKNTGAR